MVAPDQIGWGKSPKPDIHYSFQLLAANTAALLDHLGAGNVAVLGHSTGGMTAARFTLMYPGRVTHLVLEDPLGLADYRTGIQPQSEETLYEHELNWTDPAVIRGYVSGYFVHPDPKVWGAAARRPGAGDPRPGLPAVGPRRRRARHPRATRVVIPECGHIPHPEHPSRFLGELLPFLAGQPQSASK